MRYFLFCIYVWVALAGGGSLFAIHSESECYNPRYVYVYDLEILFILHNMYILICMYICVVLVVFLHFAMGFNDTIFSLDRTDRWSSVSPLLTRRYFPKFYAFHGPL